jgi:hypothetical protein
MRDSHPTHADALDRLRAGRDRLVAIHARHPSPRLGEAIRILGGMLGDETAGERPPAQPRYESRTSRRQGAAA